MVSPVIQSTTATEAEIAAAAQDAQDKLQREDVQTGQRVGGAMPELAGAAKPMQYKVPQWDQGSWVMVWELKVDANGEEYGDPTKAPRQQLGLWLQKRRPDGGRRFAVEMPQRLRAQATIPCLYNGPEGCIKMFYTRQDMVDHVYGTHPMFARINNAILEGIMQRVAEDNPQLAKMAEAIANMNDRGLVSVEVDPSPRQEKLDLTAGAPTTESFGIKIDPQNYDCTACAWKPGEDWDEAKKLQFSRTHTWMKHREELE